MRQLWNVLVLVLAVNFVVTAGGVYWLYSGGRLEREKLTAIREILFPTPEKAGPTTQPAERATTNPSVRLEELLAKHAGRPATEQLEYIRRSFDAQMVQLDRAHRELLTLQKTVELAQKQLAEDRKALESEKQKFEERQKQAEKLAADQGFQSSLEMYTALPAKQAKDVFMGMDDATAVQYLQAMESRTATKIMKEFKTQPEAERLKKILERLRQPNAAAKE